MATEIERVQNVASHYGDTITWGMSYSSKEDSWSVAFYSAEQEELSADAQTVFFFGRNRSEPIFAMRCESFEVVVEALEHWHAGVLTKGGRT